MNAAVLTDASARSPALASDTRTVFGLLEKIESGLLEIRLPDGSRHLFGRGEQPAILDVRDERLFTHVLAQGDIGLADSYLAGGWESPDLSALLTLLARNREAIGKALYGSWRALIAARLRHWLNANTRRGSRRNIMAHYDLGNDFYAAWLDAGMTYSAALYPRPEATLAEAQAAKYGRILERLAVAPGDHVLEIGCGWGGFAERAVAAGLRVSGVTLSPAQLDYARRRVPQADLQLRDYRDLGGRYDHVVSIEMFEAVGERWWPTYFRTVAQALKPGGKALIQSIVIRDDLFPAYRRGTDFIQQYIFPGGMLPSPSAFRRAASRAGLAVTDTCAFGPDYARTLDEWRRNFDAAWPAIARSGFDTRFQRLWRLYLAYCEAGFLAGSIDVVQFELQHAPA